MSFRNLDENSDWCFGRGKNDYIKGNEEIGLNIKTRLLSWVNDCFFARNAGIDWLNRLGFKNQKALLEADLKTLILKSKGVTSLKNIDIVYNNVNRSFSATYTIMTIYSKEYTDTLTMGV